MCVTQCRRENVKEMGRGRDRCRDMEKVEFQGLVRQKRMTEELIVKGLNTSTA